MFISGAGIGWLGSLDLPSMPSQEEIVSMTTKTTEAATTTTTHCLTTNKSNPFRNILSENTGPSPEYLQSLLNVNETLLAQSLANTHSTPMLTPEEQPDCSHSPLLTPTNTQSDYLCTVKPHSEIVLSENFSCSNS